MKCENIFCQNDNCVLDNISLDVSGSCNEYIYIDIEEKDLLRWKNKILSSYKKEAIE